jgi:hypothetical protein
MVTSPAQNATRVTHLLPSRTQPAPTQTGHRDQHSTAATALVVRLELPDVDIDDQQPTPDHPGSPTLRASPQGIDPEQVARAVEDLLRAVAPALITRVRVEVAPSTAAGSLTRPVSAARREPLESAEEEELRLDLPGRTLSVDGRVVQLTRREFELLAYLQRRRGVALGRRELMNAVWQTDYLGGDRTIDVHVRRLRLKLGRHAHRLSTLRGYGYRLD